MLENESEFDEVDQYDDVDEEATDAPAGDDDDANSAILAGLGGSKEANKPDISRLNPCWVDGKWTPREGDKIVMEVNTSGGKWLHTREYFIRRLNPETGDMTLWNEELGQYAGGNFKTAHPDRGPVFKMAPGRGRVIGAKRRGRPPKDPTQVRPARPLEFDENGHVLKPKRGRPKKVQEAPGSPG